MGGGKLRTFLVAALTCATVLTISPQNCMAEAFGNGTVASGANAIAAGQETQATGTNSSAFGYQTKAEGGSSTALGSKTTTSAENAVAMGDGTTASGYASMATGSNTKATKYNATATGQETEASGNNSTAQGYDTTASGNMSVASGQSTTASGANAFATGQETQATGTNSSAFGYQTKAEGGSSTALGSKTTASAENAMATGESSEASGYASNASGVGTKATAYAATATGSGTEATAFTATAFGENTKATGMRATAFGENTTASGQNATAFGENSEASGVNATAFGKDSNAAGTNSLAALGGTTSAEASNSVAMGIGASVTALDSYAIGNAAQAKAANSLAVGNASEVTGISSLAVGNNNNVSGENSGAIGTGNTISRDNTYALGNDITATQDNSVVLGNSSTDRAATAEITATVNGLTYSNFAGQGSPENGVVSVGAEGKERQIINVAAGKISSDSTDAVNGSQLYAVSDTVGNVAKSVVSVLGGNAAVDSTGKITMSDIGTTGKDTIQKAIQAAYDKEASVEAGSSNVTVAQTSTNGTGGKIYTVDVSRNLNLDSVTTGDTVINNSGVSVGGNTYVSADGLNANDKKVINVTSGDLSSTSTDAVNGSQLYQTNQNVETNTTNIQKNTETINKGLNFAADSGTTYNAQLGDTVSIKGDGKNVSTSVDGGTVTVKMSDTPNFTTVNATTINGSTIKAGDTVTINSQGADMGGTKIINVKDGDVSSTSKDAVNGGQLYQTNQRIDNVNSNVNNISNRVNKLDTRLNRVGAGAAALAALHTQDFDPDNKWDFAVGYGNYKDANAVAIGAFYRPNEDTTFSIGGSFSGGENMVNAGITWKFGQKNHVSRSRVSVAKDVLALQQQVAVLTKELETYKSGMGNNGNVSMQQNINFPDVPENHWAYTYVKTLADKGYLNGYPDGEFKGDRAMTRYEYAAIIYRALQNGAPSDGNMIRSMDEFGPEISKAQELDRFRVDRISGKDNDRHKVERVRINDKDDKANNDFRDVYGSHIVK